jgi:hypothetical protein
VGRDVGDVDPDAGAIALALGGDGVVEVAGGGRVDGEGRQRGQVATRQRVALGSLGGPRRLGLERDLEAPVAEALAQQSLDRVARPRRLLAPPPASPTAAQIVTRPCRR